MATDKIEVEKLSVIKGREGRNLDTLVDENTLITGETSAGAFGVFKFFEGIKTFFKGVTALGTLAKTNKIPVLQDDGSLKFTTPADITSGLATTTELNNALANLTDIKMQAETDANNCIAEVGKSKFYKITATGQNIPAEANFIIESYNFNVTGSAYRLRQIAYQGGGTQTYVRYANSSNSGTSWTWSNWEKITTETDLSNYQKVKRITLNTSQTLTLTHDTSPFAVKITIQGTKGFTDYFCIQYQGYGVGTYDHIFELLKGTSSAYTKEGNTLSFTVSAKTWVTIEYLIGDETTITDTIS